MSKGRAVGDFLGHRLRALEQHEPQKAFWRLLVDLVRAMGDADEYAIAIRRGLVSEDRRGARGAGVLVKELTAALEKMKGDELRGLSVELLLAQSNISQQHFKATAELAKVDLDECKRQAKDAIETEREEAAAAKKAARGGGAEAGAPA